MENLRSNAQILAVGVAVGLLLFGGQSWGANSGIIFSDSFDTGSSTTGSVNSDLTGRQAGSIVERDGESDWRETTAGILDTQRFQIAQDRLETWLLMGQPGERGRLTISPDFDFGSIASGKRWELRAKIQLEFISDGDRVSLGPNPHDTDLRFIFGDSMESVRSGESADWGVCVRFTFVYNEGASRWFLRPLVSVGDHYIPNLPDLTLQPEFHEASGGESGNFTAIEELVITVDERENALSVDLGELQVLDRFDISEAFQGSERYFSIGAARGGLIVGSGPLRHSVDDLSISLAD